MSYCGYVTRIKELRKHENADRLQVATLFGNSVIVGLDVNEGDLGVYFPTDGKLGLEFARANNLLRKDENGYPMGGYLDYERRHITSLKLRGEKSDGLYVPIESLSSFCNISTLKEGDTITTLKGVLICEKYVPKRKVNSNSVNTTKVKKKAPKESYPLFEQHVDTSQLAYNTQQFKEGDLCYITLKLHGTSQRTAHTIKKKTVNLLQQVLNKIGFKFKSKKTWDYISGTRRVTLENYSGGFYGGNEFRQQWHDFFAGKLHKGECAYYEVVGFTKEDQLIMPECDNKKTKDKEFIKQYGNKTRFTYGCGTGQSEIYVYRITMTNEDGQIIDYPTELVKLRCEQMAVNFVPILDKFLFTSREDLLERVRKFEDGADPIGKSHIREGVIVRIDNKQKFTAFKHKNFNFKCLESIVKADDILDIEEAESLEEEAI
jgi:hypothetical protein